MSSGLIIMIHQAQHGINWGLTTTSYPPKENSLNTVWPSFHVDLWPVATVAIQLEQAPVFQRVCSSVALSRIHSFIISFSLTSNNTVTKLHFADFVKELPSVNLIMMIVWKGYSRLWFLSALHWKSVSKIPQGKLITKLMCISPRSTFHIAFTRVVLGVYLQSYSVFNVVIHNYLLKLCFILFFFPNKDSSSNIYSTMQLQGSYRDRGVGLYTTYITLHYHKGVKWYMVWWTLFRSNILKKLLENSFSR